MIVDHAREFSIQNIKGKEIKRALAWKFFSFLFVLCNNLPKAVEQIGEIIVKMNEEFSSEIMRWRWKYIFANLNQSIIWNMEKKGKEKSETVAEIGKKITLLNLQARHPNHKTTEIITKILLTPCVGEIGPLQVSLFTHFLKLSKGKLQHELKTKYRNIPVKKFTKVVHMLTRLSKEAARFKL